MRGWENTPPALVFLQTRIPLDVARVALPHAGLSGLWLRGPVPGPVREPAEGRSGYRTGPGVQIGRELVTCESRRRCANRAIRCHFATGIPRSVAILQHERTAATSPSTAATSPSERCQDLQPPCLVPSGCVRVLGRGPHLPGPPPPHTSPSPFPRPTACQARGGERLFYSLDPYGERQLSYPPPSGVHRVPCPTPSENGAAGGGGREGPGTCHCPRTASTTLANYAMMGEPPPD